MSPLVGRARRLWRRSPLARDVVLFSSLFVGAELSQQTLLKKVWKLDEDPNYDTGVMARYAVFGIAVYPVVYHHWYKFLDSRFPGTSLRAVTKKVLIDQFTMEPPLVLAFYVGMSAMEGQDDLFREARQKFLPTFMAGCMFWMPATAVNFLFVAPSSRVAFVAICNFTWRNFVCWLKRQSIIDNQQQQEQMDENATASTAETLDIMVPVT